MAQLSLNQLKGETLIAFMPVQVYLDPHLSVVSGMTTIQERITVDKAFIAPPPYMGVIFIEGSNSFRGKFYFELSDRFALDRGSVDPPFFKSWANNILKFGEGVTDRATNTVNIATEQAKDLFSGLGKLGQNVGLLALVFLFIYLNKR